MTTSKQISKAIEKKHGLKGIEIYSSDGCCKFYCDVNEDLGNCIIELDTVYVCYLKHQTVDEWVKNFEELLISDHIDFNLEDLKARFSNECELTLEFGDDTQKAELLDLIEEHFCDGDIRVKGGYL